MTNKKTVSTLRNAVKDLFNTLNSEKHVAVLHCAAGIHRTGTLGYTLLRLGGLGASEAFEGLRTMREETHKGVGDWRIKLAEDELVPYIANKIEKSGGNAAANEEEAKEEEVGEV